MGARVTARRNETLIECDDCGIRESVPLGFQIQHGRVGKGFDGIDLDNVLLYRENPTAAQGD
jgi:hypothetical protein